MAAVKTLAASLQRRKRQLHSYDSAARLNKANAVCNYDSEKDTARAIYEAREINLLSSTGCLQLIWEAYGSVKYEEALRQVHAMVIGEHAIWRKKVAAVNLRKAEKTAATERATERAAELERHIPPSGFVGVRKLEDTGL